MQENPLKKISFGVFMVCMIAALTYLLTNHRLVLKEQLDIPMYRLIETPTITMKDIGECVTLYHENQNEALRWKVSNEEYLQIVKKDQFSITIKKLLHFPSFVLVEASTVEKDFIATCQIFSYNDLQEIISNQIIDEDTHHVVDTLYPNKTYSFNLVYKVTSDNSRTLEDETIIENYVQDLFSIFQTQFSGLLQNCDDLEGNFTEYRFVFFVFTTNEDFFEQSDFIMHSISIFFGPFEIHYEFNFAITAQNSDLDTSF